MLYLELFLSFLKVGFCSFGGLSMVPVISQEVLGHGWMTLEEVADILAIAEMTPGPNGLNCATFAGMRSGGVLGAIIATLGVMTPSLTIALSAAMFLTRFRENRYLNRALYGIRAVCVGMILSMFFQMGQENFFPEAAILWQPALIAGIVLFLLLKLKISIPKAILIGAALGLLLC